MSHNHSHENINLRAAIIHVIGDLLQSVGIIIAALIIMYEVSNQYQPSLMWHIINSHLIKHESFLEYPFVTLRKPDLAERGPKNKFFEIF